MYICIYVYMCVCIYVYIHTHTHTYIYIYIYIHIYMNIHIYKYIGVDIVFVLVTHRALSCKRKSDAYQRHSRRSKYEPTSFQKTRCWTRWGSCIFRNEKHMCTEQKRLNVVRNQFKFKEHSILCLFVCVFVFTYTIYIYMYVYLYIHTYSYACAWGKEWQVCDDFEWLEAHCRCLCFS